MKKDDITLSELEQYELRPNLLGQKLQAKVTSDVKVSDAAAQKYYNANKATYVTPKTREVRHILVNSKSLAETIETKLKNGASFAALAKQYSKDTGSAAQGGKLCVAHGGTSGTCQPDRPAVRQGRVLAQDERDLAAGAQRRRLAHHPGARRRQARTHADLRGGQVAIETNLAGQQKQTAWQAWLAKMAKDFKGKVTYQTGYAPATTTTPTTPAPTTTG